MWDICFALSGGINTLEQKGGDKPSVLTVNCL